MHSGLLKIATLATLFTFGSSFLVSQGFETSRDEAPTLAALSSVPFVVHASLRGLGMFSLATEAAPLLMPLPMYSYDLGKGLVYSGVGVGLYSAAALLQEVEGPRMAIDKLFLLSWKWNMESTYEIYRDRRASSADADYRDFRQYSFLDIAGASFNRDAILNPVNVVVLPLYALSAAASQWEAAKTTSVFATGKFYLDGTEVGPWVGGSVVLATASLIAVQNSFEEAYWRGFLYEELKYDFKKTNGSMSWLPASLISSALFAAWHIPLQGLNWSIASVFVLGLIIDGGYETGGLPAAAAGHGLANAAVFVLTSLMTSGVPKATETSVAAGRVNPVTTSLSPNGMVITLSLPDLLGVRL